MTTEEDNFDIDIYGDGGGEDYEEGNNQDSNAQSMNQYSDHKDMHPATEVVGSSHVDQQEHSYPTVYGDTIQHTENNSGANEQEGSHQVHQVQGVKREEGIDDRPVDPGATGALFISDLPWWITDDDIRGWANQAGCEDEVEEVTFSEHKVNGKSKGQAYVLFQTPQAATATKHLMETFGDHSRYKQKFSSNYTNPLLNPFKTLPKDGNTRNAAPGNRSTSGGFGAVGSQGQSGMNQGGFRGGRGSFNNRGSMGGYSRGGFQQPVSGGYQGSGMNNFQGGMQYGNYQSRGGMMGGMRGGNMGMRGRGGMNNMMSMPMGGMMGNMGGMSGQMPNMNMNMPGMGMQGTAFQNTGFFNQQNDNWNPHGAKRTRQE